MSWWNYSICVRFKFPIANQIQLEVSEFEYRVDRKRKTVYELWGDDRGNAIKAFGYLDGLCRRTENQSFPCGP